MEDTQEQESQEAKGNRKGKSSTQEEKNPKSRSSNRRGIL